MSRLIEADFCGGCVYGSNVEEIGCGGRYFVAACVDTGRRHKGLRVVSISGMVFDEGNTQPPDGEYVESIFLEIEQPEDIYTWESPEPISASQASRTTGRVPSI
jgi:hypothetical protein